MTDDEFACPLCGLRNDRFDDIRRHLLIAHHDSRIADALLVETTNENASIDARPTPGSVAPEG